MGIPAPHILDVVTAYLRRYPDEQERLQPLLDRLAAGHDVTRRSDFAGHVTTSGVVVNDADEVLLIHHRASGRHIQPGGHCEPSDRTVLDAVRREIGEETGVSVLEPYCDGEPVQIDVHPIDARPYKGEPAHTHFDIRYLFRTRGITEVTLQAEEVAGAQWCGPSQLGDPVLRARVFTLLGRSQPDRRAEQEPVRHSEVAAMSDASVGTVALMGGRMAAGVVRVGDTVRKPATRSSEFMARLLELLKQQNFDGAPRYLGQDDGMDLLKFIEGEVPARFQPWSDSQVRAAAVLLRQMHDATHGSELADCFDVVCHHDPGPNNFVFQGGVPVAIIDFSEAAPGSRLEDLGYLCWTWSISSRQRMPLERQAEQVRLAADAYGLGKAERHALVDHILGRQVRNVRFWAEFLSQPETAPAPAEVIVERIAWSRREHAFTNAHRDVFDKALA